MKPIGTPKLKEVVKQAIVVAHEEDTTMLETALAAESFVTQVVRGPYSAEQLQHPAQIRCLINHANAWKKVLELDGLIMVAEADFVPVDGLGELPLPFEPRANEKQMAWLYSVGPVIYHAERQTRTFFGHNAGTVAYVLDRVIAADWLSLYHDEMSRPEQQYRAWEVSMPIRLRKELGVRCYIPFRMYGEHGGVANKEHTLNKVRAWHEADRLAGNLHFKPAYANSSRLVYRLRRLRGRLRGVYRFVTGKYFDGWIAWWRSGLDRLPKLLAALYRII